MFNRVATALSRDGKLSINERKLLMLGVIAALLLASFAIVDETDESDGALTGVTINATSKYLLIDGPSGTTSATLTAVIEPAEEQKVSYEWSIVSGSDIVKFSGDTEKKVASIAVKTPGTPGTATIKVIATQDEDITKTATIEITVVKLELSNINLTVGESKALTYSAEPSSKVSVTFSTSDPNKVTVTNTGVVTGVGTGSATITMKANVGNYQKTCTATVTYVPVTSVTWDGTSTAKTATMNTGKDLNLTVQIAPTDATCKDIVWTTSNAKATVSGTGPTAKVHANSAGEVTITATAKNETTKYATCTITISDIAIQSLEIEDKDIEIEVGKTHDATYKLTPSDATVVTKKWSSSDTNIFTVNESTGVITGLKPGFAILTLTITNAYGTTTATATVTVPETYTIDAHYTLDGENNATVDNVDATIQKINEVATQKLLDPVLQVYADMSHKVTIPSTIIKALQAVNGQLVVAEKLGQILLDYDAIDHIDTSGSSVGISFTKVPDGTYPKFGDCFVYDISILKDGAKVDTKFSGDAATIAIYHTLAAGEDVSKLKAAYVYGDGDALMIRNYAFVSEGTESAVLIEANHMSVFMFMFHDSEYISAGGIDTVFVVVFIVILLILAGAVAFLTFNANAAEKLGNMFKRNKQPPMGPPGQEPYGQYYQYDQYNGNQYR